MKSSPFPDCGCPICLNWDRADQSTRMHLKFHELFWGNPQRWGPVLLERLGMAPISLDSWPQSKKYQLPEGTAIVVPNALDQLDSQSDSWMVPLRDINGRVLDAENAWTGLAERKPWDYRVTAVLVHRDQLDLLRVAIASLRSQTERPYILVVDLGSQSAARSAMFLFEAEDLEIIHLRPRAWLKQQEAKQIGLRIAEVACRSSHIFYWSLDAMLKERGYLEYLADRCNNEKIRVGYSFAHNGYLIPVGTIDLRNQIGDSLEEHEILRLGDLSLERHRVDGQWFEWMPDYVNDKAIGRTTAEQNDQFSEMIQRQMQRLESWGAIPKAEQPQPFEMIEQQAGQPMLMPAPPKGSILRSVIPHVWYANRLGYESSAIRFNNIYWADPTSLAPAGTIDLSEAQEPVSFFSRNRLVNSVIVGPPDDGAPWVFLLCMLSGMTADTSELALRRSDLGKHLTVQARRAVGQLIMAGHSLGEIPTNAKIASCPYRGEIVSDKGCSGASFACMAGSPARRNTGRDFMSNPDSVCHRDCMYCIQIGGPPQ